MVDLAIIGGGPGGYAAAEFAAKNGMSVTLVERAWLGGTCLHRGCVPTKAYLHAAETAHAAEALAPGVLAAFDRAAMLARKDATVAALAGGLAQLMKTHRVRVMDGQATLESASSPFTVRVRARSGETERLEAGKVLIATGSAPVRLPVPGCERPNVWTSDDLLTEPGAQPFASLLIVGGGVIGVEAASIYARLGVRVTVLEAEARLLPMLDVDLGRSAEALLKGMGVALYTGTRLLRIVEDAGAFTGEADQNGQPVAVTAERVLLATGRAPVTDGLLGEGVTVAMARRAIAVDAHYRTSLAGVYAVGDVNGGSQLAHAAHAQALAALSDMLGIPSPVNPTLVPACVYTAPEMATVGMTQSEAKERGLDVAVGKALTTQNARTLIEGLGRGFIKLIFARESRRLVGAQLFCGRASDLVGELTVAIAQGLTAAQLASAMRPHPTFEEAVAEAAFASGLV